MSIDIYIHGLGAYLLHQLNILHRAAARTCLILLWIHAISRVVNGYEILAFNSIMA